MHFVHILFRWFFCFVCFFPTGMPVAFQGKMASIEFCYPCTQVTNENMRGSWDSMGDPSTWGSIDMHLKKMYSPIEHDRWHRERDIGLSVWLKDKTAVCVGVPGCSLSNDNQEEHRTQRSRWTLLFPLRNLDKQLPCPFTTVVQSRSESPETVIQVFTRDIEDNGEVTRAQAWMSWFERKIKCVGVQREVFEKLT